MKAILFEDNTSQNLSPLNLLRPNYLLKTGIFSLKERIEKLLSNKYGVLLHSRGYLKGYLKELFGNNSYINGNIPDNETVLLINGKIRFRESSLTDMINLLCDNSVLVNSSTIIMAKVNADKISNLLENIYEGLTVIQSPETDGYFINEYPWDLLRNLEITLKEDIDIFLQNINSKKFLIKDNVYISESAKADHHTSFDTSNGEIIIDEEAVIEPFSFIKGPAYIGKHCLIKSGTRIYGPCSLGIHSRVSGEISGTIFHGYSNKQHDGFIGNSYVSEFVNLGADTVTSNLKNNYSIIKTRNLAGKPQINTKMQFFGTVFGDHTKTGINTMLNTGSVIGIFALLAGGGFPDKFIENFSWYIIGKNPIKYKIDEALETARMVMSRRGINMSDTYEKMVRYVYTDMTSINI